MRGYAWADTQGSVRSVHRLSIRSAGAGLAMLWVLAVSSVVGAAVLVGEDIDPRSPASQQVWQDEFRGQNDFLTDAEFKADMEHIQEIMQTPALAAQGLRTLAGRVTALMAADTTLTSDLALERALTEVETRHSFSTARIVPSGILPAEVFLKFPAEGFVLSDVGATPAHGEFAHRLQWAMIMADYEKDFSEKAGKWNFTPIELYIKIFERDQTVARDKGDEAVSLFAHLFDQAREGFRAQGEEERVPLRPDGYRHPERLTKDLRSFAEKYDGTLPKPELFGLADAVRKRFEKWNAARETAASTRMSMNRVYEEHFKQEGYQVFEDSGTSRRAWKVLVHEDDVEQVQRELQDRNTKARRIDRSRNRWGRGADINKVDTRNAEFKDAKPPRPQRITEEGAESKGFRDAHADDESPPRSQPTTHVGAESQPPRPQQITEEGAEREGFRDADTEARPHQHQQTTEAGAGRQDVRDASKKSEHRTPSSSRRR